MDIIQMCMDTLRTYFDNMQMYMLLSAAYLILYWLLGAIPGKKWRLESIPAMCLTGFLIYYTLFQIIAFPLKLMGKSLTLLMQIWGGTLAVLLVFVLVFRIPALWRSIKRFFEIKERTFLSILLIGLTIAFGWYICMNTNNISPFDAAHYIGYPVSSAYSDTLEKMSAYTGRILSRSNHFYVMNTDMLHSALIYKVFGIHPLGERMFSFSFAMICLFEMTIYGCGRNLLKQEYFKQGIFVILANMILFYSYSSSGVSQYFAYRTYEGKSVVAYLFMLAVCYYSLVLYKLGVKKRAYLGLALCGASAIGFCNTALFLVPLAIGCSMTPFTLVECFKKKNIRYIGYLVLILIPSVIWIGIYKIV